MNWTQPICARCYTNRYPDRQPACVLAAEPELCCDCGEPTQAGIYFRVDPRTVKHPAPEPAMTSRPAAPESETPEAKADNSRPVHAEPELLDYWRTLPAPSNERLAVEIIETLQRELQQWTRWGIIEISVRNSSVADYCAHWEGRAEKAETALSLAQTEIERERMRVVGCSVAALGNWREGDSLHADYDCAAIRDVAKLRVKYDEAQARIAELEKAMREVEIRLRDGGTFAIKGLTWAIIDAALKDRA